MERITIDGDETTALRPTGETRVECGWCGHPTLEGTCSYCGRDPLVPYTQRGPPPTRLPAPEAGRPSLEERRGRNRLSMAAEELGPGATVERTAEYLGVSPRTVRRWKAAVDGR